MIKPFQVNYSTMSNYQELYKVKSCNTERADDSCSRCDHRGTECSHQTVGDGRQVRSVAPVCAHDDRGQDAQPRQARAGGALQGTAA